MKIAGKEAPDDSKLILAALKAAKDANKKFKVASTACACLFTRSLQIVFETDQPAAPAPAKAGSASMQEVEYNPAAGNSLCAIVHVSLCSGRQGWH